MEYPISISWKDLTKFLNDQSEEELFQSFGFTHDELSENDKFGLLPEDTGTELYQKLGFVMDDDGVTLKNPCALSDARHLSDLIQACYAEGYISMNDEPLSNRIWEALGLSGDDDVDYCGTHVGMIIDVIGSYLTR